MLGAEDAEEVDVAWYIALAVLCATVYLGSLVSPILIAVFDDKSDDEATLRDQ